MICKVSLTTSGGRPEVETTASCELVCDEGEEATFSEVQVRRLQDVCLAVISQQNGLASQPHAGTRRSPTTSLTLRQLARLYRAAYRLPAFDFMHLQNLSRRLYQKPLEELSMLEVAAMTSTINAVIHGMVDIKELLKTPCSSTNGDVGNRLA